MSNRIALSTPAEEALFRRIRTRIAPLLVVLYLVAFLDRVNISFAALTMNRDLGIGDRVFGWGAGIFFIGYLVFAVPANMALERLGVRRWIATIMVVWGLVSAAMAFVPNSALYLVFRFLLGAAEAGFFPGIILYMTFWLPERARARVNALFILAVPLANVLGAPASTWILRHASAHVHRLHPWQVLFLVEALPAILLGLLVPVLMSESPQNVAWLSGEEKATLAAALAADMAKTPSLPGGLSAREMMKQMLATPGVLTICAINFAFAMGLYALGFWVPKILTARGVPLAALGWWTAAPFAFGALGMLAAAASSDRSGERRWHMTVTFAIGAAGLTLCALSHSSFGAVAGLSIAAVGVFGIMPILWTAAPARMPAATRAIGIAFVNGFGNVGGFLGPVMIGSVLQHTGSYVAGLLVTAAALVAGGTLAMATVRR
jgi:ACS family tartrate transporter-like MFS transporter